MGCEVTRGDPRGGGGALSRQRAGGLPYSLVFEVHPCPAHHLPGSSFRSMTSSSPPPRPAPFRRGSGHQTRAPRSGNGQQRDALRERAVAAAQHQPCQRLGWRARRRWRRSRRRRLRCEAGGEGGNGIGSGGWDGGGAGGGAAAASVDDRGGAGEGGTGRRHGAGSVVVGRRREGW